MKSYNDYGIEEPIKREKTLRDEGIRVDAVGIQGHWTLDQVPFAEIDAAIDIYAQTGAKVIISELDIRVGTEITSHSLQVFSPPAFVAPSKEYWFVTCIPTALLSHSYTFQFHIFHRQKSRFAAVSLPSNFPQIIPPLFFFILKA